MAQSHNINVNGIKMVLRRLAIVNQKTAVTVRFIFVMPRRDLLYTKEQLYVDGGNCVETPKLHSCNISLFVSYSCNNHKLFIYLSQ